MGIDLITAILPHPVHGRLAEFPLLMVNKQINVEGVRYDLVWRDGAWPTTGRSRPINRSGNQREGTASRSPSLSFYPCRLKPATITPARV